MLCTVAKTVLLATMPKWKAAKFEKLINDCLELNNERNRIAHGLWYVDKHGAQLSVVPRNLKAKTWHYENANDLASSADLAAQLRNEIPDILYSLAESD
jgi:hypothetical protein